MTAKFEKVFRVLWMGDEFEEFRNLSYEEMGKEVLKMLQIEDAYTENDTLFIPIEYDFEPRIGDQVNLKCGVLLHVEQRQICHDENRLIYECSVEY